MLQHKPAGGLRRSTVRFAVPLALMMALAACGSTSQSGGSATDRPTQPATTTAAAPSTPGSSSASAAAPSSPSGASGAPAQDPRSLLPAEVQKAGKVNFAATFGIPPIQYLDDAQKPTGFTIDLANDIGRVLGIQINYESTGFNALMPGVMSGRYDGVMGAMTITPARTKQVIMVSYAVGGNTIVVRAGNPHNVKGFAELCGLKVATLLGSTNATELENQSAALCTGKGKPAIQLVSFADSSDLQAVETGRADAQYDDYIRLSNEVKAHSDKLALVPDFFKATGSSGAIFAPKNEQLAKAFQAAFEVVIKDGSYDAIIKKWNLPDWVKPASSEIVYTPGS